MRIAELHFQGIYDKSGRLPSTSANEDVTKRKIALAEGLVDAYDGTLADRNRSDNAITLFDKKTHDVVQVKTQKDGSRYYRVDHNQLDQGLLWGKRSVTKEIIEVSSEGQIKVSISRGEATTGGYLTGPLLEEKLPKYHSEQTFLFSDASLRRDDSIIE